MYSSKCFNSNLMDFLGHEKSDKLIWTSGEFWRYTNTISKQVILKIYYMTSTSSKLGSEFYPHKDTFDILS